MVQGYGHLWEINDVVDIPDGSDHTTRCYAAAICRTPLTYSTWWKRIIRKVRGHFFLVCTPPPAFAWSFGPVKTSPSPPSPPSFFLGNTQSTHFQGHASHQPLNFSLQEQEEKEAKEHEKRMVKWRRQIRNFLSYLLLLPCIMKFQFIHLLTGWSGNTIACISC